MKEVYAFKLTSGSAGIKCEHITVCVHGSVTVSLPMKTYLWRIWSVIQLHSRNRARSGFTLKTRILLCVCCEQSLPKCDHLQREAFPSVFLIVLWIKPWSFLKKQNKNQRIQFLLYMLHISFFKKIYYAYISFTVSW